MENCLSFVQFDQRTLRVDYSGLCEESCRIMLSASSWQLRKQEESKMSKFKPTIMIMSTLNDLRQPPHHGRFCHYIMYET